MCNPLGLHRIVHKTRRSSDNNFVLRFKSDTSFKLIKNMCKYTTYIAKKSYKLPLRHCYAYECYGQKVL